MNVFLMQIHLELVNVWFSTPSLKVSATFKVSQSRS